MKIKYIPQLDAMDCGAAALAMIISYYGKNPDITEIRKMCIPKKNGISLYSISQAAGHLGFRTIEVTSLLMICLIKTYYLALFTGIKNILLYYIE